MGQEDVKKNEEEKLTVKKVLAMSIGAASIALGVVIVLMAHFSIISPGFVGAVLMIVGVVIFVCAMSSEKVVIADETSEEE